MTTTAIVTTAVALPASVEQAFARFSGIITAFNKADDRLTKTFKTILKGYDKRTPEVQAEIARRLFEEIKKFPTNVRPCCHKWLGMLGIKSVDGELSEIKLGKKFAKNLEQAPSALVYKRTAKTRVSPENAPALKHIAAKDGRELALAMMRKTLERLQKMGDDYDAESRGIIADARLNLEGIIAFASK